MQEDPTWSGTQLPHHPLPVALKPMIQLVSGKEEAKEAPGSARPTLEFLRVIRMRNEPLTLSVPHPLR